MKRGLTKIPLWIIATVFFVLYAVFPNKFHFIDGLGYAWNLENLDFRHLVHPHHPIYLPFMKVIFEPVRTFAPNFRAMPFLSFSNALLGGLSIFLFMAVLNRVIKNKEVAILAGIMLGSSWGMMTYCTDANIYILTFILMLTSMWFLLKGDELSLRDAVIATGLVIFASLMHQIVFFFTFAVLVLIILRSDKKQKKRNAFLCSGLYAIVILLVNYAVYLIAKPIAEPGLQKSFINWITVFGGHTDWWTIQSRGLSNAYSVFLYTQMNLFVRTPDSEMTQLFHLYERSFIKPEYIALHFLIIATCVYEIVLIIKNRNLEKMERQFRIALLVWFIPYFVFLHFYSTLSTHFKIYYFLPLIMIWTIWLFHLRLNPQKFPRLAVLFFLLSYLGWNFHTGLTHNSQWWLNPSIVKARIIAKHVEKDDLVIFSSLENYDAAIARCYTDADTVAVRLESVYLSDDETGFLEVDQSTVAFFNQRYEHIFQTQQLKKSKPRHLYFSGYFFKPPHPWYLGLHPSSIYHFKEIIFNDAESLYEINLRPTLRYRQNFSPIYDM